ncbi:MAG: solute carrier family 23 protein [Streptococcus sp.]
MQNKEKHSQAAVLGLQHLLAMYSGSILVPIMIAGALGYSAHELTYLISTDIFMCGVATSSNFNLINTSVSVFHCSWGCLPVSSTTYYDW